MNNKNKKTRVIPVAKIIIFFTFFIIIAFAYVWQHMQLVERGFRIKEKEQQLQRLLKDNEALTVRLSKVKSPESIQSLIDHYHLDLVHTNAYRVIHLQMPEYRQQTLPLVQPSSGFMKLAKAIDNRVE